VIVGQREGETQLYLRSLDQEETRPIAGTAGAQGPFFSPDGQWIGFWAGGRLMKWPVAGGRPTVICPATAENGAAWLPDDVIVFSTGSGLQRVSVQEGHPEGIATLDTSEGETDYESPVALPGGNAVMFSITYNSGARLVAVLPLNTGKWKTLVPDAYQPRFIAPGFVVVNRSGTLAVAPLDLARLKVDGPFTRLGEGAPIAGAQSMGGGADVASYDVAAAGRSLVYVKTRSTEAPRFVYSLDLHGKPEVLSPDAKPYADAALSPDGSKLAVDVKMGPVVNEIWVLTLASKTWTKLTTGEYDWQPAWQDEDTLIYSRGRDNQFAIFDVYAQSVTANTTPTLLASSFSRQVGSQAVAPDHSAIVFGTVEQSSRDLWIQPLGRGGKATDRPAKPLVTTPANEYVIPCAFSPNTRWLAYTSNANGRNEIWVTDIPKDSRHKRWRRKPLLVEGRPSDFLLERRDRDGGCCPIRRDLHRRHAAQAVRFALDAPVGL
jgi:serine/threonine-protein kinase